MSEEPEVCTKISDKVKMAGFLEKKGSMLWKRYWFVLEDKLLLYYKSQLEYINLSPCRGSLNMNLVCTIQPRRNSKEPVIHLVSRAQNLVLKAKDRTTQEKWLQALLDSMGKGMSTLRFSLDDLPGEIKNLTLPRKLHGGSLDAVWKPAIIPKNRMMEKVLGFEEEETDENQNMDALTKERKSQTLDNRKIDSRFDKLRNAIARRKSSNALIVPERKLLKTRSESFLRRIFIKKGKDETPIPDLMVTGDTSEDDPLYDTIDHATTPEPKPVAQKMLPAGMMAELKDKLRAKEPPELPPRVFAASVSEVVVHVDAQQDDSEESEVSGHYQTIQKPVQTQSVEADYQVVNKEMKKKNREKKKSTDELSALLCCLTEITSAPLVERDGLSSWPGMEPENPPAKLKRSRSDPDYDIPRPHAPLVASEDAGDADRIPATEFFNKAENLSVNSLEPDSLESRKE